MPQTITPYLLYKDVDSALGWLSRTFGFREAFRMPGPDGTTVHAEMELSEHGARVFMGSPGEDYRPPSEAGRTVLMYVMVEDVDAHFAHAREAGATIVEEPADQEYGERRYAAEDPEGHQWFFAMPINVESAAEVVTA
jgi:PhnB protein